MLLGSVSMCWACTNDPAIRPLPGGAETSQSPFAAAYQQGKEHLLAGRNGLAIVYFERSLALDPSSVAALNALGTAYDELSRYDLAQKFYTTALKLDPQSADTWNNMAVSLRLAGAPEPARKFLVEATKLDPADATIRANMAELDDGATGHKLVPAIWTSLPEPEPEVDQTRPQLRRVGLQEYDLGLPGGSHPGRDEGRRGVIADPLRVEAMPMPMLRPALDSDVPLAAPVIKVAVTPLPPPAAGPIAASSAPAAPDAAAPADVASGPAQASDRHAPPRIELANGAGRRRMAARVRSFLDGHGVAVSKIGDARPFDHATTVVAYQPGWADEAAAVARLMPRAVSVELDAGLNANIRVVLGRDLSAFDRQLEKLHADEN
jgi:hypothetical protein